MRIDFILDLEDSKTLKVYDTTPINFHLPLELDSITIDITGSRLPNGRIDNKLDVISYLKTQQYQKEIFTINSAILGLANEVDIPDGILHFYYSINNILFKEHVFLVYQKVQREIDKIVEDSGYEVSVGDYNIQYIKDDITGKYDIEKIRYAITLLDNLKFYAKKNNEVEANNTLDKLERLLTIIKEY